MNKFKIEWVACHRKPERSFFYRGKQFPVCARCTGIYIGYISIFVFAVTLKPFPALWSLMLMIPLLVDGLTQAYSDRVSNNTLRLTTGILFGVGLSSLGAIIAKYIGELILNFWK